MAMSFLGQKRLRKYYGKIREVLEMPNLIEVQKSSYDLFLKSGDSLQPLDGEGIKGVFQSVFPIKDFNETALVPTMGNLHDGHLSLLSKAKEVGETVLASIYINPLQFGVNEDFDNYPRTLDDDLLKLEKAGCDFVFCPSEDILKNIMKNILL